MKESSQAAMGKKMGSNSAKMFAYSANPNARQVYLVGDFTDWNPTALPMSKQGEKFVKRVQLQPGEHQYKFFVDGEWQTDPAAEIQVPNGVGSMNSVVKV